MRAGRRNVRVRRQARVTVIFILRFKRFTHAVRIKNQRVAIVQAQFRAFPFKPRLAARRGSQFLDRPHGCAPGRAGTLRVASSTPHKHSRLR